MGFGGVDPDSLLSSFYHNHHYHRICLYSVHMTSQWEVELKQALFRCNPSEQSAERVKCPREERDKSHWISTSPCPSKPITQPIPSFSVFSFFFSINIWWPSHTCILLPCRSWSSCSASAVFGVMCLCVVSSFLLHNKTA